MTLQAARQEVGIVVNASLDKTITVLVQRKVKHPLYKKILKRTTKILVHDGKNECSKGDEVTIYGGELTKLEILLKNMISTPYSILTGITPRVERIYK